MSIELRLLSLGELLDRSFTLYRRHFATFVGIMAIPAAVTLLIGILTQVPAAAQFGWLPSVSFARPVVAAVWLLALLLLGLVYWIVYMLALGATSAAVAELYESRSVTVSAAYQRIRDRVGRFVLLILLVWLRMFGVGAVIVLVGVGVGAMSRSAPFVSGLLLVAVIVAGLLVLLFMAMRYALVAPVVTLEDVTANDAIQRSIDLTQGRLWRVLLLGIFAVVIAYATLAIFQGPLEIAALLAGGPATKIGVSLKLLGVVTGAVASAVSGPVMIVALAVLYYDARVREEGLDLQMMIARLDAPAESSAGYPA